MPSSVKELMNLAQCDCIVHLYAEGLRHVIKAEDITDDDWLGDALPDCIYSDNDDLIMEVVHN